MRRPSIAIVLLLATTAPAAARIAAVLDHDTT